MPDSKRLDNVKSILTSDVSRVAKGKRIAEAIRDKGLYRWVGIYEVDIQGGLVSNIAWSGPSAPAHPIFPVTKGLTARAIAGRKTINVDDLANDSGYLTAFDNTRAKIIVPVLDIAGNRVIGTIDVESEHSNAFDTTEQEFLGESPAAGRFVDPR
jgi:putative methionine-R-sulfoxide reductase with GAF domain